MYVRIYKNDFSYSYKYKENLATMSSKNDSVIQQPDYLSMIKQQGNSAVLSLVVTELFSKNLIKNRHTFYIFVRNIILILFIKTILEDSKSVFDKFSFSNFNTIKYIYQRLINRVKTYEFMYVGGDMFYGNQQLVIGRVKTFFEKHGVSIEKSGTSYMNLIWALGKVVVSKQKITLIIPEIGSLVNKIDSEISTFEDKILGQRTSMTRLIYTSTSGCGTKLVAQDLTYAFKTKNYSNLENIIRRHIELSNNLKTIKKPLSLVFDGKPGTGKTTFGNFIAQTGLVDFVLILSMNQCPEQSIDSILTKISNTVEEHFKDKKATTDDPPATVIVLDEMDKWINSYINSCVTKRKNQKKTVETVEKKDNVEKTRTESFEEFTPAKKKK